MTTAAPSKWQEAARHQGQRQRRLAGTGVAKKQEARVSGGIQQRGAMEMEPLGPKCQHVRHQQSLDQVADDPVRLKSLTRQFKSGSGKSFAEERLLSELLRMRKQGLLTNGQQHPSRSRNGAARLAQ